jgi:hypothetical protein
MVVDVRPPVGPHAALETALKLPLLKEERVGASLEMEHACCHLPDCLLDACSQCRPVAQITASKCGDLQSRQAHNQGLHVPQSPCST